MNDTLVILAVGALVAGACALVGCFLVLRRMALLGDAISHAVLPGIVIAFLLTESRSPLPMILGAAALGVLTVFLVERLHRTRRLYEDASIGVVFPALFAIGVILVSRHTADVDLDLDCVLYGEIAYTPWDVLLVGGASWGPRALWICGTVFLADLLLVGVLYKELKLTSFDPALAASLGVSPVLVQYVLMAAVSVTVVGSFESVGAILVVALLVVPPAAAYLLTDRLSSMLLLSVALGFASVGLGYAIARTWDASIAGGMATAAGAFFLLALLASPRHGLWARALRRRAMTARLGGHLLLLHLQELGGRASMDGLGERFRWSAGRVRRTAAGLARRGWITPAPGGVVELTPAGRVVCAEGPREAGPAP